MPLTRDCLYILIQLSMFWNFSQESRLQTYESKVQLLTIRVSPVTNTVQTQSTSITTSPSPAMEAKREVRVTSTPPVVEKTEARGTSTPPVVEAKREVRVTSTPPVVGKTEARGTSTPPVVEAKREVRGTSTPPVLEKAEVRETSTSQKVEKAEVRGTSTSPVVEKVKRDVGRTPMLLEHKCNGTFTAECPRNWLTMFPKCLALLATDEGNEYNQNKDVCVTEYGAMLPDEKEVPSLGPCMKYLLGDTPLTVTRLQGNMFIDVSDMTPSNNRGLYRVFCVLDRTFWAPPHIEQFSLKTFGHSEQMTTGDLMKSYYGVRIERHEYNMTVICAANGYPEPQITISRDNVTLIWSRGLARHVAQNITCQDSGVYTCQAKNAFNLTQIQRKIQVKGLEKIESFRIEIGNWKVLEGDNVWMSCKAAPCSEPRALMLLDDTGTVMETVQGEYLIHEIRDVKCSAMRTYFCRLETESGATLQQQVNLEIALCAPQLCYGENKTNTVHAVVGQNVTVSVCIISPSVPLWYNIDGYSQIQVFFEKQNFSDFYYTATITISDIQEQDQGKIIISIGIYFYILDYTINLQVDKITMTASSSSPQSSATTTETIAGIKTVTTAGITTETTAGITTVITADAELLPISQSPMQNDLDFSSQETMNHTYIIIIAVLIGVIFASIIGVFVFIRRCRGSVNEENSANHDDIISLSSLYDVIEDDETVLPERSSGQRDTDLSDNYTELIDIDNPSRTSEHERYVSPTSSLNAAGVYEDITDDQPGSAQNDVHLAHISRVNDVSDYYTDVLDGLAGTLENTVSVDQLYRVNLPNNYPEVIIDPAGESEYGVSEPQTSCIDVADNYVELIDDPTGTVRDEDLVTQTSSTNTTDNYVELVDDPSETVRNNDPVTQTSFAYTVDTRHIYVELLDDPPVTVEDVVPITQTVRVDTVNNYDKLAEYLPEIVNYDIPIIQTSSGNTDNCEEIIEEITETVENEVPATQTSRDGSILACTERIYIELTDEPAVTVSFGVSQTHTSSIEAANNYVELIDDPTKTVRDEDAVTQTSNTKTADNYVELIDELTGTMRNKDPIERTSIAYTGNTRSMYVEPLDDPPVTVEDVVSIAQTVRVDTAINYDKLAEYLPEIVKYDIPIIPTSSIEAANNYVELIDDPTKTVTNEDLVTQTSSIDAADNYVELIDDLSETVGYECPTIYY